MFWILFLAFTLIPILELYLLIKIGGMIGALNTVAIIFTTALIGAFLARQQGMKVLYQITTALREGYPPGRELVEGALVLIGGILLLTPGFFTDFLGLTLLIPQLRSLYSFLFLKWIQKRISSGKWRVF
ncbi:MAG: FxsA family protein [Calditrichaeota bacterium]|nr:MAG: FxsA family protein [Calditrichota bacterium]